MKVPGITFIEKYKVEFPLFYMRSEEKLPFKSFTRILLELNLHITIILVICMRMVESYLYQCNHGDDNGSTREGVSVDREINEWIVGNAERLVSLSVLLAHCSQYLSQAPQR